MKKSTQEKLFTKPLNVLLFSLICTMLWGSAFPCIKIGYKLFALDASDISGKLVFAGIRFLIAGLIILVVLMIQGRKIVCPDRTNIKGILLVSITQTVLEYIFFYISMSHTTGVKGSIINASSSFFVVVLAHLFYKNDKITLRKMIGCTVGFLGIIIINIGASKSIDFSFHFMGEGMMILSAFSFAVGSLIGKNVTQKADPRMVTGYQLAIGGATLLILGICTGGRLNSISLNGILLLIYMACLSAVAFTVWTILSKYNKMSKVAIYNFLTPVFGALLSALFLGEELFTISNILALTLVCGGIYIVNRVKIQS
jgi:drug/metabolite transporter (DMT)-like permease